MKRAFAGAAVLAAEYLALAVLFDGTALAGTHAWWAAFGRIGGLVSLGLAVFTAGLLIRGRDLLARLKESAVASAPLELRWAVAHAAAFCAFALITSKLFGGGATSSALMSAGMVAWLLTGSASFFTLFRVTFGSEWRSVARAVSALFAGGLVIGLLAWLAGPRSLALWPSLAGATLRTSGWMLAPFVERVRVIPERLLLGIDDFDVIIGAPCSGMEGLGAVLVFLAGYLFTFRERLKFPQSLLLVPVALAAVWVMNAVRIAALVAVGAYVSPDIALGGFHSKAGWLGLCLVALGVVVATRQSPRFARATPTVGLTESPTAAFLMPLVTFAGVGLVAGLFTSGTDWLYPVRAIAAGAVAFRYRREYPKPVLAFPGWGLAMGVLAFAIWSLLARGSDATGFTAELAGTARVGGWLRGAWVCFRVLGAVTVVPVIEELAFRGFLQRRLIDEDFTAVPLTKFTWPSLVLSSLAFGSLHESWLAAVFAGAAYSLAGYRRGRLEEAVVAHATTNALLFVSSLDALR